MIGADDDQRSHGSVKNLGVVANLLLFVGDFATTGARSAFVPSRSPLATCHHRTRGSAQISHRLKTRPKTRREAERKNSISPS